jgi:hypothetical protein
VEGHDVTLSRQNARHERPEQEPRAAGQPHQVVHAVQLAFADSTQTVFYIMAGVMAVTFVVAVRRLPRGRVQEAAALGGAPAPQAMRASR